MTLTLIDALSLHSGGARTHLRELLFESPGLPVLILATPSMWRDMDIRDESKILCEAPERTRNAIYRMFWRRANLPGIARARGATVYLDPAGGAPDLPIPRVTMVRNMLPFDPRAPEWYGRWTCQGLRLRLLRHRILDAVARCDGTIYISRWSRDTIKACLMSERGRSTLISHGVKSSDCASNPWPESPRWLYVSDIEPYKHQIEAALAYDSARAQGAVMAGLTLAGGFLNPAYAKRLRATIENLRFGAEIELTGWLGRADLKREMDRADALMILSSVECCPNILLEGLASGKPIICSKEPPMPEFAKDAVVYADPSDPMSIAAGIRKIARLADAPRHTLTKMARVEASHYTWKSTAEKTWSFIEEISSNSRRVGGRP